MKYCHIKVFLILTIILLAISPKVIAEEINVATIKDLKPLVTDFKKAFEEENPGIVVTVIAGKESELIEIIERPDSKIDVLILDSKEVIDALVKTNFIDKNTVKTLARDSLCVVVKKSTIMRPFMLYPQTVVMKALATGNPGQTALGRYTKEALTNLNLWEKASKKIVLFEGNQFIAKTVARGQYDGGIMYCSFAKGSFVTITDYLNDNLHKPILYVSGVRKPIKSDSAAYKFNSFLVSPEARNIMKKYHFSF